MNVNMDRKSIAKDKIHLAIENFKQAELEGAENFAPVTYRWAKVKIYEDKKRILNSKSTCKIQDEASEDACAASAQLLSAVRKHAQNNELNILYPKDFVEKEAIDNLINEGGPTI